MKRRKAKNKDVRMIMKIIAKNKEKCSPNCSALKSKKYNSCYNCPMITSSPMISKFSRKKPQIKEFLRYANRVGLIL